MKEFIYTISQLDKQKKTELYVSLSLCLMFIMACSTLPFALIGLANLINAVRLGYKNIPDFGKEE